MWVGSLGGAGALPRGFVDVTPGSPDSTVAVGNPRLCSPRQDVREGWPAGMAPGIPAHGTQDQWKIAVSAKNTTAPRTSV